MQKIKRTDIKKDYTFGQIISQCIHSELIKATHLDYHKQFMIKRIFKDKIPFQNAAKLQQQYQLLQKVQIRVMQLDHPNIGDVVDAYDNNDGFYLIMQYSSGGDVCEWLSQLSNKNQTVVCSLLKTLNDVLEYCHGLNMMHLNLKPENILMATDNGIPVMKVMNVGMSRFIGSNMMQMGQNSLYFQAPQVLAGQVFDKSADYWSLGVITYLLLCGKLPYRGNQQDIRKKIQRGQIEYIEQDWQYISSAARDLVEHLLQVDVKKRYNSARVRNHPWLSSNFQRQHPDLTFNLKKYNADRNLRKYQQMLMNTLNMIS